tara:strand:- start:333 stop:737 length:405 start_codon:yes stop_codon:yes gene_type:complete
MAKKTKGTGLYQDRGAMGKLPVHRKMGDMFPHSAPTQESDWLRYRGVFDHYKDGEMSGAGLKQQPVAEEHKSSADVMQHPSGGKIHRYTLPSGTHIYKSSKHGHFGDATQKDWDEATAHTKFQNTPRVSSKKKD